MNELINEIRSTQDRLAALIARIDRMLAGYESVPQRG